MDKDTQRSLSFWNETFRLRLIGAELYHLLVVFITLTLSTTKIDWPWRSLSRLAISLLSPKPWAFGMLLLLCQGLSVFCTFFVLKTHRQPPLRFANEKYNAIDHFLEPVFLIINPLQGPHQLKFSVLFLMSAMLSGSIFVRTYLHFREYNNAGNLGGFSWGTVLGFTYAVFVFAMKEDILAYPVVFRKRIFAVKQALPIAGRQALEVTAIACLVGTLAALFGGASTRLCFISVLPAMLVCSFCWFAGLRILKIVFSERLRFLPGRSSDEPNSLLFAALTSKDDLIRQAALVDLCHLAESNGPDAARRAPLFADESGSAWVNATRPCLEEVSKLVTTLAAAMPGPGVSTRTPTAPTPRWNALPLALRVTQPLGRSQEEAAWLVAAQYQRIAYSLRALSALTAASRREDHFGVVQLSEPSLATVLGSLTSALLVLQHYLPHSTSISRRVWLLPPRLHVNPNIVGALSTQTVDMATYGLTDTALLSLFRVVSAFRESALDELGRVAAPLYGSRTDLLALASATLQSLQ
eukprot:jgi/Botrbrau1/2391/Bobra.0395s0023.1